MRYRLYAPGVPSLATYHTIPYHTIPYYTIPYHTIPYHTIPYHTIPWKYIYSALDHYDIMWYEACRQGGVNQYKQAIQVLKVLSRYLKKKFAFVRVYFLVVGYQKKKGGKQKQPGSGLNEGAGQYITMWYMYFWLLTLFQVLILSTVISLQPPYIQLYRVISL